MPAEFTIAGQRYVVIDEKLVTTEYTRTIRRHGVEVKEPAQYSYVAVNVREVSHVAARPIA